MSEYTKGKLHRHDSDIHIQQTKPDGSVVEHSCIAIANDVLPNFEANATELVRRWNAFEENGLVADLLEACERAMRIKKLWCPDELYGDVDEGTALWTMHDTIKAAIAKAKQ